MNKIINIAICLFLTSAFFVSCNTKNKTEEFDTSKGKLYVDLTTFKDSVEFVNNVDSVKSKSDIQTIMNISCLRSKLTCTNTATFKPLKLDIYNDKKKDGDTIVVYLKFTAANAYGTPSELTGYGKFLRKNKSLECVDFLSF